jgi:hypothetical protein
MIESALIGQLVLFLVVTFVFLASRQSSLFHPVAWYLAFHGLVFVVRPILVYAFNLDTNWDYMVFRPSETVFVKTLAVSSVALVVLVGAALAVRSDPGLFFLEPATSFTPRQRNALAVTTLVFLPLIAWSIYATRNGIEGERIGGVYINTTSVGYVNDAQFAMAPLLCAWLLVTRFRWFNVLPLLLYLAYRTWFGWSRWTIVLFLAMTLACYCWHKRIRWLPLWTVLAAVPFFALFNLLGHNRDVLKNALVGEKVRMVDYAPGMALADKMKKRYDTVDFGNFDFLAFILSVVPERTGAYTYGAQYLQLFTEPIPRRLWKGKPVGPPVKLFNLNAYGNFIGLTYSLPGDGWMNGGWVGLIITMGVAGVVLGGMHRWFWQHANNNLAALLYLVSLSMLPQWFRDGGISIAKFLLWSWLPLLLWSGLAWLMGPRLVPVYSFIVPRNTAVRLIEPSA